MFIFYHFLILIFKLEVVFSIFRSQHCSDVIMSAMASQTTSLSTVYSTVYSGADQRKHQSSVSLAFVRGIHRWPVNFQHKGQVTRKIFPFDDVIMKSGELDPVSISDTAAEVPVKFQSYHTTETPISRLRDFTRSYEKISYRILKLAPGSNAVYGFVIFIILCQRPLLLTNRINFNPSMDT